MQKGHSFSGFDYFFKPKNYFQIRIATVSSFLGTYILTEKTIEQQLAILGAGKNIQTFNRFYLKARFWKNALFAPNSWIDDFAWVRNRIANWYTSLKGK